MPVADIPLVELFIEDRPQPRTMERLKRDLIKRGFQLSEVQGTLIVHDYPTGIPSIIEIMTSSTSGGNKRNRTQIPQAFEDAMLDREHSGPGINYRQVWARMVSQLLVKSETALGWGGKAIWLVQDVLVDYIAQTTGLNIYDFSREQANEVNLLSAAYEDSNAAPSQGVLTLKKLMLFSGALSARDQHTAIPSFADIVRLPIQPPLDKLTETLIRYGPARQNLTMPSL